MSKKAVYQGRLAGLRQAFRRLSRIASSTWVRSRSASQRARKWLRRRRTPHPATGKCPVFVVGSNRSGTQMVCKAIGRSPHGWDYRENQFSIAFNQYYLRRDTIIRQLIGHSPAPIVSFGSILDSQVTPDLLSRFKGAKAIWVYRHYRDAVNSSVRKWGCHQKDLVRWVARGEIEKLGPRGKNLSADTVRLCRELFRESLSDEEGGCLYWYMRNQLYFDLNLHRDSRVLLVQYSDAVRNKDRVFRKVFDFLGFPFDPAIIEGIFATSVGKNKWAGVDPRIDEVCGALKARFDAHYSETSAGAAAAALASAADSHLQTAKAMPAPGENLSRERSGVIEAIQAAPARGSGSSSPARDSWGERASPFLHS